MEKRPLIRVSQTHTRCNFRLLLMINDQYLSVYTLGTVAGSGGAAAPPSGERETLKKKKSIKNILHNL